MIRNQILIILGVIFVVFFLANVIEAFDNTDTYWQNWGSTFTLGSNMTSLNSPLPSGSWIQTAKNYSINGNVLTAELKNESGNYVSAGITITPGASYSNNNGTFVIDPSSAIVNSSLPSGPWIQTAKNYSVNNNVLTADLLNESGNYVQASITITPGASYSNSNGSFVIVPAPAPAPAPSQPSAPFNPVDQPIKSASSSNLCLDVWQNSMNPATQLDMWACNGQTNQQWTLNNGNLVVKSSGQCMDVNEAGTAAGTVVQQYPCGNPQRPNQMWTYVNGTLRPSNAPNMCLDVTGSNLVTGARTVINPCNGSASQKFTL